MGATSADNLVHYEERMLSSKYTHARYDLSTLYSLENVIGYAKCHS